MMASRFYIYNIASEYMVRVRANWLEQAIIRRGCKFLDWREVDRMVYPH